MSKNKNIIYKTISVLSLFILWEGLSRTKMISPEILPPFTAALYGSMQVVGSDEFLGHLVASLYRWAIGFSVSLALSIPMGITMARSKRLFNFLDPLLTLTYPVPKAAIIPILMLWVGPGDLSKVIVIIIGCFIPLVISAYHGAQGVETTLIWSAKALGTSERAMLFRIILPASLPTIFSGIRMALAISLIIVLGSEMIVRQSGLGYYLFNSLEMGLYNLTYSVIIIISGIGLLLNGIFSLVMRKVLVWA